MSKLTRTTALLSGLIAVPFAASIALANDTPPADAKPLSEVVKSLEDEGYERISDVSFDDGKWEVDAYKGEQKRDLEVDPHTGDILSDKED